MRNKVFKGVFTVYLILLFICCFWDFRGSIDLNTGIFGPHTDKVVHFLLFLPFPVTAYFAFPGLRDTKLRLARFCLLAFLAGTAIGTLIEKIQGWTGYRSCDIIDVAADCCGLVCAIGIVLLIDTVRRYRETEEKRRK